MNDDVAGSEVALHTESVAAMARTRPGFHRVALHGNNANLPTKDGKINLRCPTPLFGMRKILLSGFLLLLHFVLGSTKKSAKFLVRHQLRRPCRTGLMCIPHSFNELAGIEYFFGRHITLAKHEYAAKGCCQPGEHGVGIVPQRSDREAGHELAEVKMVPTDRRTIYIICADFFKDL